MFTGGKITIFGITIKTISNSLQKWITKVNQFVIVILFKRRKTIRPLLYVLVRIVFGRLALTITV